MKKDIQKARSQADLVVVSFHWGAEVARGELPKPISKIIVATLILVNLFTYLQRMPTPSDVWFFWIPFIVLGLYWFAWRQLKTSPSTGMLDTIQPL